MMPFIFRPFTFLCMYAFVSASKYLQCFQFEWERVNFWAWVGQNTDPPGVVGGWACRPGPKSAWVGPPGVGKKKPGGWSSWTPICLAQPDFFGIVKEMAGKWILSSVPEGPLTRGPKKSGWVGGLDPEVLKRSLKGGISKP
jgi:hypothetical protein